MVECAALEMQYTGNRIEGSNPSLSAIHKILIEMDFCLAECIAVLRHSALSVGSRRAHPSSFRRETRGLALPRYSSIPKDG